MTNDHKSKADAVEQEAKRDLDRVNAQSEVLGSMSMARVATKARDHMMGADAEDQEDWAEVWGRRIGRSLGALFAIYLVYWLVTFLTRSGVAG